MQLVGVAHYFITTFADECLSDTLCCLELFMNLFKPTKLIH
uniref:Uncharacterized protein n=1 Tax=Rhizophora mucronata TaxID=61149 RepID=A0A2P2NKP0_RHIMU